MPSTAQIVTTGNLRELNISYCSIDSGTTCDLARALHDDSQLRDLRLRGNPISQAGAEAVSSMLKHNHCLKSLDLTGCSSIGEAGVLNLIAAMCRNVSLKVLQLPYNLRSTGRATEGYDSVQPRIKWTSDISTQEVVVLSGSDINSFIGNKVEHLHIVLHGSVHRCTYPGSHRRGEGWKSTWCPLFCRAENLEKRQWMYPSAISVTSTSMEAVYMYSKWKVADSNVL